MSLSISGGIWTNHALDHAFAPKLSQLYICGADALESSALQRSGWLSKYILTTLFTMPLADPMRQLGFSLIRRADHAAQEYERGREELAGYIATEPRERIVRYSRSLSYFETAIAATYQCWAIVRMLHPDRPSLFEPADGSDIERMNMIYNASKHLDERLIRGQAAEESTLHIWLTNDGIETKFTQITFVEFRDLIDSLCRIADKLANGPQPS